MAITTAPLHKLDLDDVMRMVEAGILGENERVELVDGVLVDLNPIGPEHETAVERLNHHFAGRDTRWRVRTSAMLLVPDGYVLPDLMVIELMHVSELPRTAHLVVEVAQTSHERDREKAAVYATIGVREYWLLDLVARELHVHREPSGDRYAELTTHRDGDSVQPLVDAPPVAVASLLDD